MKLVFIASFAFVFLMFLNGCSSSELILEEATVVQTGMKNSATTTPTNIKTQEQNSSKATPTSRQNTQGEEDGVAIRFLPGWHCEVMSDTFYEFVISVQNVATKELNGVYLTVILYGDSGTEINSVNSIVIPSLPREATFTVKGTLNTLGFKIDSCEPKVTDENGILPVQR